MAFHDLAADGQADTGSLIFVPAMKPLKNIEYFSRVFRVKADAVVLQPDPDLPLMIFGR